MSHAAPAFSTDEVMIVGSFRVTPEDLTGFHRARSHDDRVELNARIGNGLYETHQGCSTAVPQALLVQQAIAELGRCGRLRGAKIGVQAGCKTRVLGEAVAGEVLGCVATVRFHSIGANGDECVISLLVEVRRPRGGTLLRFEVVAEFPEKLSGARRTRFATRSASAMRMHAA